MTVTSTLLENREQRILGYIKDDLTAVEIARREGLQPDYALRLRNQIAAKHGVTVKERKSKKSDIPYGLDDESRRFRSRLGDDLWGLLNTKRLAPMEVARKVGVPRKLQAKAINKPFAYNWSLGEIQQMAKLHNMTLEQYLHDLLERNNG